jgi:antitoxin YefM
MASPVALLFAKRVAIAKPTRTASYTFPYLYNSYFIMEVTTLTKFRRNMRSYFENTFKTGKPLLISRPGDNDMVLMKKDQYTGPLETLHLLSSPKNAQRLLKAVQADRNDEGKPRKIHG